MSIGEKDTFNEKEERRDTIKAASEGGFFKKRNEECSHTGRLLPWLGAVGECFEGALQRDGR